jgi:hypothetical protein
MTEKWEIEVEIIQYSDSLKMDEKENYPKECWSIREGSFEVKPSLIDD